jgi:hypothetical protein
VCHSARVLDSGGPGGCKRFVNLLGRMFMQGESVKTMMALENGPRMAHLVVNKA